MTTVDIDHLLRNDELQQLLDTAEQVGSLKATALGDIVETHELDALEQDALYRELDERGIELVEVPDEEFETMGPNVLALGPRHALALEGNDETRRRMEAAGVEVLTYRGDEISRKGDGGPTCLTRPLLRG